MISRLQWLLLTWAILVSAVVLGLVILLAFELGAYVEWRRTSNTGGAGGLAGNR